MSFTFRTVASKGGLGGPPPRRPRPPRERRGYSGWLSLGRLRRLTFVDFAVGAAVLVALYVIVRVGRDTTLSFAPTNVSSIDTSPALLPYYAARSLLRMFIALGASYLFTFVYAYVAAHSRRAEKIMIPALDILQSVPVLGFLSITVTGFIALFPGSYLGLELASIFAIFTAQAWNLTFSFYQSLISQPGDLDEAARLMRLSRWRRFWQLDVPNGTIGLVWNGMMSMGGGWFFLVASEAISVLNKQYALPGIGSYAGAAIDAGALGDMGLAVLTMMVVVVGVNIVFWRPLVAWSEKFKNEQSEAAEVPRSLVLNLLRRSHWPRQMGRIRHRLAEPINRFGDRIFGLDTGFELAPEKTGRNRDLAFWVPSLAVIGFGLWKLIAYVTAEDGWRIFLTPLWDGLITFARVIALMIVATLIWVPIGVKIGTNTRASRFAQPIVQVLASFPANFLFPFAVWAFIRTGISLNLGGVLLMSLGAQWYVLFNVIAGAQAIPSDLTEAMDDLGVHGWQRWRRLLLPAIFPSYVTGGITATGGAWNASIVAEIVTYGGTTLTATGLGAYIADATQTGDFHRILAGVTVMAMYIVGVNRLFWRRLYSIAETRYL
ncbi:MAG: ABC transporter permease subunit [Ilumatobacteraceae bacterium]